MLMPSLRGSPGESDEMACHPKGCPLRLIEKLPQRSRVLMSRCWSNPQPDEHSGTQAWICQRSAGAARPT